jgi:hypothetical protein
MSNTFFAHGLPCADEVVGGNENAVGENGGGRAADDALYASLRDDLNVAKTALDDIPEAVFAEIKHKQDRYSGLKKRLREFKAVTNAWLKMIEILHHLQRNNVVDPETQEVRLFANGELPGAFISAVETFFVNQNIDSADVAQLRWCASSLAVGGLGDKYHILKDSREAWLMDCEGDPHPDPAMFTSRLNNGDMTDPVLVKDMVSRVLRRNGGQRITLATADGATGVAPGENSVGGYNMQEEANAAIILGEVVCALGCLAVGGTFVVKMYTFNLAFTRSLMAYVASRFRHATVYKPQTSRPGNSEVYFACAGYLGCAPGHVDDLLALLVVNPASGVFDYSRPVQVGGQSYAYEFRTEEFNGELARMCGIVTRNQIASLETVTAAHRAAVRPAADGGPEKGRRAADAGGVSADAEQESAPDGPAGRTFRLIGAPGRGGRGGRGERFLYNGGRGGRRRTIYRQDSRLGVSRDASFEDQWMRTYAPRKRT